MKTTSSWALEINESRVIVSKTESEDIPLGAQVIIEVFGQKWNLFGQGIIHGQLAETLVIKVSGPFTLHPATENARASMVHMSATVITEGSKAICNLMDVSLDGCAFEGPLEFERDQVVSITLHTHAGDIAGKLTVRNCRPKDFTGAVYRTGGTLEIVDRIAAARWAKVLSENISA